MTYFNFVKIAPPAPNDPNVDEVNQINNNWDHVDDKLAQFTGGSLVGLETGMEWISSGRFRVWTGAASRVPDNPDTNWSAWTALTISASVAARSGFTLRWRSHSDYRKVQLSGGLLKDAGAGAWPTSAVTITAAGAGQISSSFAPIGNRSIQQTASALPGGTANAACGMHLIDTNAGIVRIQTSYLGGPGGGNFVQYDGVEWWY